VLRNEIYDDYSIFTYSENIQVESIPAVSPKSDFVLNDYFVLQNQNTFPTNKDIKFKLRLENKLDTDIYLKKMEIISPNQDIRISSEMSAFLENEFLAKINENLSILKNNSELTIPVTVNSSKSFIGLIGKIVFFWIDKRVNNENLVNQFEAVLPEIEFKGNELEISYTTSDDWTAKSQIELKVKISNKSKEFKKVLFIIDNSTNFLVTGPVKKKVLVYPNDSKELNFFLIPLCYGNLKLPPFKVVEENINPGTTSAESEKKAIYFVPDLINISGN